MVTADTDEEKIKRAVRSGLGDRLGELYGDVVKQSLPAEFIALLRRLDGSRKTAGPPIPRRPPR